MDRSQQTPRTAEQPTPGFYRLRMAKGAPWQPARIMHSEDGWLLLIAGEPTESVPKQDPWKVRTMHWAAFAPAISEAEYIEMMSNRPPEGSPTADPTKPVDWRRGKPLF